MVIQFRQETRGDADAIEKVTIAAFAHAPHTSHTEQFIVRALRATNALTLSIVAEERGQIVGHVAVSPVSVAKESGEPANDWYGLGPISVLPERQRQGVGSRLMAMALSDLKAMGAAGCVLLGEPAYYTRFGFRPYPELKLPGVPPEYFLTLALHGPVPEGLVRYSEAFEATA